MGDGFFAHPLQMIENKQIKATILNNFMALIFEARVFRNSFEIKFPFIFEKIVSAKQCPGSIPVLKGSFVHLL